MPAPADFTYARHLSAVCEEVFAYADICGWSVHHLSIKAKLSYATVIRLQKGITRRPQERTIFRLVSALGWQLVLDKQGAPAVVYSVAS
jgi:hypothetical protein